MTQAGFLSWPLWCQGCAKTGLSLLMPVRREDRASLPWVSSWEGSCLRPSPDLLLCCRGQVCPPGPCSQPPAWTREGASGVSIQQPILLVLVSHGSVHGVPTAGELQEPHAWEPGCVRTG